MWTRRDLVKELNKGNPVSINIEINQRCSGGCLYCYASSMDGENLKNMVAAKYNCAELYMSAYTPVMAAATGPVLALSFYSE